MKLLNKLTALNSDDFFHVINMLYLDDVVTCDPAWMQVFEAVGQEDAETPISLEDRLALIAGLKYTDPETIHYYIDTLPQEEPDYDDY